MTIYNINTINSLISKEFARFLKEKGIYMDYVRNVLNYYHYDIAYIKKYCKREKYNYIRAGFLWKDAKYPSRIENNCVNMSHFWNKVHSDWIKEISDESNKQKNN